MILSPSTLAILSQAVVTRFTAGLGRAVTPWAAVAMEIPSTTGENIYPYLKDMSYIREWIGDRQIQNLAKGDYRLANKTYEMTQGISRESVEDDTYGVYGPLFEQAGQNVASFVPEKVYQTLKAGNSTLCGDGQFFFDTDHPVGAGVGSNDMAGSGEAWYVIDSSKVFKPVIYQPRRSFDLQRFFNPDDPQVFWRKEYIWGVDGRAGFGFAPFWQLAMRSAQTLDEANLKAALVAMSKQTGDNGKPLNVQGTHLVVGPNLAETARDLLTRPFLAGGASNTMLNRLQLIAAPELL